MKSYISHQLMVICDQISLPDDILMMCMERAFDWANQMGLEGKKVSNLSLQGPNFLDDPLAQQSVISCQIECTLDERKLWDDQQKFNYQQAVRSLLEDE